MGVIIFNGKASTDYGIVVENPPSYQIPKRRVESISVPGRNGNIIIDEGVYDNVAREYNIAAGDRYDEKFTELAQSISHWLNSAHGNYARLEDSYEPEYFRMAVYSEEIEIENVLQQAGRATISFDCKPQRYLKRGENVVTFNSLTFNSDHIIVNPTQYEARPLIILYAPDNSVISCNLIVNDCPISVEYVAGSALALSNTIVLDSEMQDAYDKNDNHNLNFYVALPEFPVLSPGNNIITYVSGNLTKMEVKPRWWVI